MKYVIVGTAGHIDHGKTALVKALTGVDCDRWEEEKRRGITIDIGFAALDLDSDTHLAFVDVPGHERFVKNMLAGAHGIDILMLVVAADESVMPQTREHFEIAKLLNVKAGLTVVTKCDLVDAETQEVVVRELNSFFQNSFLENRPILSVSSRTGQGLEALKEHLRRLASEVTPKDSGSLFRLPIDRAFTMKGFGTVVTGTLISGQINREDEVEVLPKRKRARVRGIQVHNRSVSSATAGQRTAINLQGVEVNELARGMVLAPGNTFQPTSRLDVELHLLDSAPAPLKSRNRVHFHIGTAEMVATLHLLDRQVLEPGDTGIVQVVLSSPTIAQPMDRFVVRRLSPVVTIGGGMVLDPIPPRRVRADPQVLRFLEAIRARELENIVHHVMEESGTVGVTVKELTLRTGLSPEVLRTQLGTLSSQGKAEQLPARIVSTEHLRRLHQHIATLVSEFHSRNPLAIGISRQELKERLGPRVSDEVFEFMLKKAQQEKSLELSKDLVHSAGRSVSLSTEEDAGKKVILDAFRVAGLSVPSANEVLAQVKIDRSRAGQIVQLLVREGRLVRVTSELMFHADSIQELRNRLLARKSTAPRMTVSEFKELTGITRKYAIPLLEFLDRERVTRRDGDVRVIL
ncbi:MAG: selenocysteine-specific translation elongation factor [Acidobacteriia bacterium]|nr:selenocysteine-specific translation elongation factor [Terriglobia bacterium]